MTLGVRAPSAAFDVVEHDVLALRRFEVALLAVIPNIRAFAGSLCSKQEDAEDLAQETIAKALKGRASYQPGTNLRAWAFAILYNHFVSGKRHAWRTSQLDPAVAALTLVAVDDAEASLELKEVSEALAALSEAHGDVLIRAASGARYDEMAEALGITMGTLKSRLWRARAALRDQLETGRVPPGSTADRRRQGPSAWNAAVRAQSFDTRSPPPLT